MTVAGRVTSIWPETEALLLAKTALGYAGAKTRAISDSIDQLWRTYAPGVVPPSTVDGAGLVLEQQVADLTVLLLLPLARDYYAQQVRPRGMDVAGGVGGSVDDYDKLKAMDALRHELAERLNIRARDVALKIRASTVPPTAAPAIPMLFTTASGGRGR